VTRCLESARASLYVVAAGHCQGGAPSPVGRALHIGAAVESRAHPQFRFEPTAGTSWADRLDFEGNEHPYAPWPKHDLACVDGGGGPHALKLAFTYADFALLEPAYRAHFRVIPDTCPTPDLTPVEEFPLEDPHAGGRRIPFVWGAGADGRMVRLVISRRLLEACRDRLAGWRALQELAGIHNAHVERAVAAEREEAALELAERLAEAEARHAEALADARRETAGEAMGKLAEMLLRVDLSQVAAPRSAPRPAAEAAPAVASDPEAAADAPAASVEEEDDVSFDDPYIDSPLCTTCNDCINLNPQMFKYNENKQAQIADPDAGTFEQLVIAAEKCPAKCIHPGKPRNPDEPELEWLIQRAKPFN
jgi:ferredoxin